MSPNPLYQAAVSELEHVLSPRVVSRSLKEGLSQTGSSPDRVELGELERILKAQIYRQLQVAMPLDKAKQTISGILDKLRTVEGGAPATTGTPTPAPLDGQNAALEELKTALRPFNLYFEWPEVQKLRAQIQLLENQQAEGKEASGLLRDAREQLRAVSQKLEDSLVIQARDLGELEDLLEQVRSLGGPKVRRMDSLLGQIREAQNQRQLATAEIERGRKLGTDLRKLLESSVLAQKEQPKPDDTGILLEVEPDEDDSIAVVRDVEEGVNARLQMIDVESERHELGLLESNHANLLAYRGELREQIERLRAVLEAGDTVSDELGSLRDRFVRVTQELRSELAAELSAIDEDAHRLGRQIDTGELSQAVQVTRGVLEKSLPEFNDVRHVRDLHTLAKQRHSDAESLAAAAAEESRARLQEQEALIARLDATLREHSDGGSNERKALEHELAALRSAHSKGEHVPELLTSVRRSEERYQASLGDAQSEQHERPDAAARALLAELESLPLLPAMRERARPVAESLSSLATGARNEGRAAEERLEEGRRALKALRLELENAYRDRMRSLRQEASDLGQEDVATALTRAEADLAAGEYPRLHEIEADLRGAADRRRQDELTDTRVLEQEAQRFAGLGLPGYSELCGLIDEAKGASLGAVADRLLGQAWLQLEALRSTVEQRLDSLQPRLDAALLVLARVEKLNSEDVEESRRILRHLDDQRDSLTKVSLGLRLELEYSLQRAESLLTKLQQEYEATRAIADQLVSGNFVDDMLGLLGGDQPRPQPERDSVTIPEYEERQQVEARSDNPKLNAWVEGYLSEEGVSSLALLDESGRMVAGRMQISAMDSRAAIDRLMSDIDALGTELGRGNQQLTTLESGSRAVIASRPIGKYRLLAVLDTPSALSRVLYRLRSELTQGENKTSGATSLA